MTKSIWNFQTQSHNNFAFLETDSLTETSHQDGLLRGLIDFEKYWFYKTEFSCFCCKLWVQSTGPWVWKSSLSSRFFSVFFSFPTITSQFRRLCKASAQLNFTRVGYCWINFRFSYRSSATACLSHKLIFQSQPLISIDYAVVEFILKNNSSSCPNWSEFERGPDADGSRCK